MCLRMIRFTENAVIRKITSMIGLCIDKSALKIYINTYELQKENRHKQRLHICGVNEVSFSSVYLYTGFFCFVLSIR